MGKYSDFQNTNTPISPNVPMYLTPEEKAAGINEKLKVAARRYLCPKCGREFSLFQSRAVACKYCPKASDRCPNVRCPYCDSEFPINGFVTPSGSREDERTITDYTDQVFNRWADRYNRR
ncbi:MAG: hypothetical protein MJZ21_05275 [archaeon]|nr:hypothetical protein [archaeon]